MEGLMPDEPRIRRLTSPPLPPSGDRERLVLLEHKVADIQDDLHGMREDVAAISRNLTIIVTQKEDAEKAQAREHAKLERWKTAGISLLGALALGLVIWIARIAMIVQAGKVLPPP
jgi:hypothetical protein